MNMDFENYIATATGFILENRIVAIIVLGVFILLAIKKTKTAVKILAFATLFIAAVYIATNLGSVSFKGLEEKREGVYKTKKILDQQEK